MEKHRLEYPIFAVGYMEQEEIVLVAGGGGATKSGIANGVTAYQVKKDGRVLEKQGFLSTGSKAAMSLAVHPRELSIVMGVGERCWLVNVDWDREQSDGRGAEQREIKLGLTRAIRSEYSSESLKSLEEEEFGYQKCCAFDASGLLLATGGVDGIGRLWEYPSLTSIETFDVVEKVTSKRCQFGQVQSVDILNDYLLIVREKAILIYDFESPDEPVGSITLDSPSTSRTPLLPASYRCGRFFNESVLIAAGDLVAMYSVPHLRLVSRTVVRTKAVTALAASGHLIAYGCSDGSVGVLSSSLATVLHLKEVHAFSVSSVCFAPNLLLSASVDGTLSIIPSSNYSRRYGGYLVILLAILIIYLAYLWNLH